MFIFDFDGTIVDLWPRYYSVFKDILNLENLDFNKYKRIKQFYHHDFLVAKYFGKSLTKDYFKKKSALLEDCRYLEKDLLLVDYRLLNEILAKNAIVLTKRRNVENFYWQLTKLKIKGEAVVVQAGGSKKDWVASNIDKGNSIIIIGDSLTELEVAQLNNVDAWMVGYGLNTKKVFDVSGFPYRYFETPEEVWNECRSRLLL